MLLVPAPDGDVSADLFSLPPMLVQADGRFDFAMVPPGQYRLMMVHRETGARSGGPSGVAMGFVGARGATPPPAGATMSGRGPGPRRISRFSGPTNRDRWRQRRHGTGRFTESGRRASPGGVQWIGAAPPPPAQMLQRALGHRCSRHRRSIRSSCEWDRRSDASRRTRRSSCPARCLAKYIISSIALPGYPTLKSVTVGGLDITDMALEVGEKDIAEVVITYVDTPMASLTVVSGPAPPGAPPADDPWILVFPLDRKFWTEPAAGRRRFRSWGLAPQGTTTTNEMPAGDYFVVRVTSLEALDWQEAIKLDALSRRAQRVTVPDTGTARVEVRR